MPAAADLQTANATERMLRKRARPRVHKLFVLTPRILSNHFRHFKLQIVETRLLSPQNEIHTGRRRLFANFLASHLRTRV